MKQCMKRVSAILVAIVMAMTLVACGGGEDTKETVQATVDQLQAKMTEAMSSYQNIFSDTDATDPSQASERIDTAIKMIDDAIAACDSVDAPGPDSQKYRDICKDLFQLLKDMMNDMKGIDMSDSSAATEISTKYMSELLSLSTDAAKFAQELVDKYGITMPTTSISQ
ncbi:MAG: hypothetical protein J5819_04645 [Eubacterium sp.]|nr:hypothetical protein [Eubacterium sp.]